MYKDAHLCRKTHTNACWWKIFNLLKGHLDEEQLDYVVKYRSGMLDIMLENDQVGEQGEQKEVRREEDFRKEGKYIDIRNEWSWKNPKMFNKSYRPKFVDWESERLFKAVDPLTGEKSYMIVPKIVGRSGSIDRINGNEAVEILLRR